MLRGPDIGAIKDEVTGQHNWKDVGIDLHRVGDMAIRYLVSHKGQKRERWKNNIMIEKQQSAIEASKEIAEKIPPSFGFLQGREFVPIVLSAIERATLPKEDYDNLVRDAMSWRHQQAAQPQRSESDHERAMRKNLEHWQSQQRSEQQEWTVIEAETKGEDHNGRVLLLYHIWTGVSTLPLYESDKQALQEVCDARNAALTAECQRREQAEKWLDEKRKESAMFQQDCSKYYNRLLSALAAIEKHNKETMACSSIKAIKVDLSLLHKHDAEVRKSLVDALKFFRSVILSGEAWTATCQMAYDDALAKVKEKRCGM